MIKVKNDQLDLVDLVPERQVVKEQLKVEPDPVEDDLFKIRYYDMISNEVLVFCILRHLPLKDLFRCQRVCKEWNRILKCK